MNLKNNSGKWGFLMVVQIRSMGLIGVEAFEVGVETDISKGIPLFEIGGLATTAVKESRDRVRAAIKNSGLADDDRGQLLFRQDMGRPQLFPE